LAQVVLIFQRNGFSSLRLEERRWSMLEETATVVSTSGNKAKVAIVRSEACGSCQAKSICSAGSGNINVLEVLNPVEARPGEKVLIKLPSGDLLKATALVYLLPAAAMVAGAAAVWLRSGTDLGAIAGALAGLTAAAGFLFLHDHKEKAAKGPTISEILSPDLIPHAGHNHKTHRYSH
jgi:sigma-E factor negative regulatory protein RseC